AKGDRHRAKRIHLQSFSAMLYVFLREDSHLYRPTFFGKKAHAEKKHNALDFPGACPTLKLAILKSQSFLVSAEWLIGSVLYELNSYFSWLGCLVFLPSLSTML